MAQAALERGTDPEKLKELFALAKEFRADQAAEDFERALSEFQSSCPAIEKTRPVNGRDGKLMYKFASLEDVEATVLPHLRKVGINYRFDCAVGDNGMLTVTCWLSKGVHKVASSMTIPSSSELRISDQQRFGAALSYAKRFALCNALAVRIVGEDNDAQLDHVVGQEIQPITLDQVQTIEDLIAETKTDRAKFLAWAGVGSLQEMPKAKYAQAVSLLQSKRGHK